jgi:hypothetical protein
LERAMSLAFVMAFVVCESGTQNPKMILPMAQMKRNQIRYFIV